MKSILYRWHSIAWSSDVFDLSKWNRGSDFFSLNNHANLFLISITQIYRSSWSFEVKLRSRYAYLIICFLLITQNGGCVHTGTGWFNKWWIKFKNCLAIKKKNPLSFVLLKSTKVAENTNENIRLPTILWMWTSSFTLKPLEKSTNYIINILKPYNVDNGHRK